MLSYVVFSKSASARPQASSTSKSEAESASACANYVAFPPRSCSSLLLCPFAGAPAFAGTDGRPLFLSGSVASAADAGRFNMAKINSALKWGTKPLTETTVE